MMSLPPDETPRPIVRKRDRLRRLTGKIARFVTGLISHPDDRAKQGLSPEHPIVVRSLIPDSWFTKRGPGVEARARQAFRDMRPSQRVVAMTCGWCPKTWADEDGHLLNRHLFNSRNFS